MKIVGPFLKINLQKKKPQDPNPKQKHKREREREMEMHYTKVIAKVEAGIGILASCVLEELEDFAIPLLPGLVIVAASAALSLPGRSLSGNALALALEHLERRRERERASVWMRVTGG